MRVPREILPLGSPAHLPRLEPERSSGAAVEAPGRSRWQRQVRARRFLGFEAFIPVTVLVALVLVPLFGVLASRLYDEQQYALAQADELEQRVVAELAAQGFGPLGASSARSTHLIGVRGIEVLAAKRSFRLDLAGGPVTGDVPARGAVDAALPVLVEELGRYSRPCLRAAHFKRILLCQGLAESGQAIPSLPNYEQSLLIDVRGPTAFLRRLLHHEHFHFLDFADDQQLSHDPAWESLNGPEFSYGLGGRAMREPGSARLSEGTPGFLSRYATSAVEEDKAEVFAFLMVAPRQVRAVMERDKVVRAKAEAIRQQVARMCPDVVTLN